MLLFILQGTASVPLNLLAVHCSFWSCKYQYNFIRDFVCYVPESDVCMETGKCVDMSWNIIQHYLFVYHSYCLLYCLISTVNVTGCTVLTLCDSQLAVPASNCTLSGYVQEYFTASFLCLSQLIFVILPLSTLYVPAINSLYSSTKCHIMLCTC